MAEMDFLTADANVQLSRLSQLTQQFTVALINEDVATQATIRAEFKPLYESLLSKTQTPPAR